MKLYAVQNANGGVWHASPLNRIDDHGQHRTLCGRYGFVDVDPAGEPVLAVLSGYSGPQADGSVLWEQLVECRWCLKLAPAAVSA